MKIKCPQCDFENEESNKFCSECNTPLAEPKIPDVTENPYIKIKKGGTNTTIESKETLDLLKEPFSKMRFFSKDWFFALWHGERPLWEAWWVLGVAVYLGFFFLLVLPTYLFQLPQLYYSVLVYARMFLQIFLWIIAWQCAPNVHNKAWYYLARFLIFVAVLMFLVNLSWVWRP